MNENLKIICNVLNELKESSYSCPNTDSDYKSLLKKYDMLFLGSDRNIISVLELQHTLKEKFNFNISRDELMGLIPTACEILKMKIEPKFHVKYLPEQVLADYDITLF